MAEPVPGTGRGAAGRRAAAGFGAAACAVGGALLVTVAVVAGPGPGLTGYVSEAGVTSSGYASAYRLGIFVLAAGLLLFGSALAPLARGRSALAPLARGRSALAPLARGRTALAVPARGVAVGLLVASSVCTLLSGAVSCSDGCPLPPFESATTADLVHGAASIAAVASCVFAMIALAWSPGTPRLLRWVSAVAAAVALPLSATVALAMVLIGRGTVIGVAERVLLADAVAWVLVGGVLVGSRQLRSRSEQGQA